MTPVTSVTTAPQSVAGSLADAAGVAASQKSKRTRSTRNRASIAPRRRPSQPLPLEALISSLPALIRAGRAMASAVRNRRTTPGYAATARESSAAKGPLSFLKDPRLSIEEKLMRLLAYQNEKWEKEMQGKLDQLAEGEDGQSSSKTSSKTPSGSSDGALGGVGGLFSQVFGGDLLGGVGGAFSQAFGGNLLGGAFGGDLLGGAAGVLKLPGVRTALEKVGGPVLGAAASALGFPAAAPLLVKYGGKILGAAAGAVTSAVPDSAGSTGAKATDAKTTGAKETGAKDGKAMSDAKRQQLTMEIQRLYEKQKEMFSLVSAIMRVSHETRSTVIGNIR